MSIIEHEMGITSSPLDDRWAVWCSCGWEAFDEYETREWAIEAWDDHCDAEFIKATST